MKPDETKRIYEKACKQRRMTAAQEEFELWHKHLRSFEARDVQTAVDAWDGDVAVDEHGQAKARWLPKPAELKPLVIAAQQKRLAVSRERRDFAAYRCPICGYSESVFSNSTDPRHCKRCDKPMTEMHRERAA